MTGLVFPFATPSCLEFRELLEMRIVVREIESMLLCARKDQEIGQRDDHTGCPSAIASRTARSHTAGEIAWPGSSAS
jgi:hypothetical protein